MGTTARRPTRPRVPQRRAVTGFRPSNLRYPAPTADRLRLRRTKRRDAIPWLVRLFLALALLALGAATTFAATGLLGSALSGLGGTVAAIFNTQLSSPASSATPQALPDAPRLVLSGAGCTAKECWTNRNEWTVRGFVPLTLTDQRGYAVRIYVNGEQAAQAELAGTQDFSLSVTIPDGPSTITATIVGPAGEGPESQPITVVFDDKPPPIGISSPKDGQTIKSDTVTIRGTTQAGSAITVKNQTNGGRASGLAGDDGTFAVDISLTSGANQLEVTAVDPAGNATTTDFSVVGSTGLASASLSLTATSFKASQLPAPIGMTVRVLGADGKPISGAHVVFSIQAPGIGPIQSPDIVTVDGEASFNTQIPQGATAGAGLVTVSVTTVSYGTLTDTAAFRIS